MGVRQIKKSQTAFKRLCYDKTLNQEDRNYLLNLLLKNEEYDRIYTYFEKYRNSEEDYQICLNALLQSKSQSFQLIKNKAVRQEDRDKVLNILFANEVYLKKLFLTDGHFLTKEEYNLNKYIAMNHPNVAVDVFTKINRYNIIARNLNKEDRKTCFQTCLKTEKTINQLVKNILELTDEEIKELFYEIIRNCYIDTIKYILEELDKEKELSLYYKYITPDIMERFESIMLIYKLTS